MGFSPAPAAAGAVEAGEVENGEDVADSGAPQAIYRYEGGETRRVLLAFHNAHGLVEAKNRELDVLSIRLEAAQNVNFKNTTRHVSFVVNLRHSRVAVRM